MEVAVKKNGHRTQPVLSLQALWRKVKEGAMLETML